MSFVRRCSILILLGVTAVPCWPGTGDLQLQEIVNGLSRPLFLTSAGDGSGRIFIAEQPGRIRILENGSLLGTPFLDISSGFDLISSGERGLLGLAFHPDYASNGRFFINYTRRINNQDETVIQRHQVSANPNVANSNGQILLTYSQPYDNHNGGWLGFGPEDGLLYIAAGDGGLGGDPEERAQDLSTLLGKMLRIDVDSGSPYGIPSGNPFDGVTGARDEIWAYGLRNPWRASFDPPTGRLFVADVGQGTWEEVDIVEKGKNYGWDVVEGPECFEPSSGCDFTGLESPIHWYGRSVGRSVTGGYVYRGQEIPSLVGDYVFGDYRSGRIWALTEGPGGWSRVQLFSTARSISSFGVDEDLELYLVDHDGSILKLTSTTTTPAPDLVVTKNSQEDNYFPDEDIVFEIDVQNQGPGDATDVTLTDNLPAGLSFVSAAPSQGSCSSQGSTVTCDLGAIDNNSSAQVTLTAKAVQPGEFTNSASAVSDPPDSNNGNNSGDFTGMIGESADLSLKKSVESTLVEIGTEFDYTIEVTNHGPSTATQVLVRDSLATGLSPVSAPDPCHFLQNEQFFCEFTAIGANSSRAVDFRVRAAQTGQIDNSATVSASQVDPVDTNNFDSVSVTIVATPDLEVRKTDLGPFVVGSTGYYRLLVSNVGNAAPGGPVTISDELPPSLGLLSAHSAGWSCETNAMSLFCSLQDSLPPGQSRGLTLAVLVGPGAVPLVINEARVSNSQDINPGNDSASISTSAFEVGVLPRRFAQLALGDVFSLSLLVSNKGLTPWEGQGLLRRGNEAAWGGSWALNGTDRTGTSHFEIFLPPEGTKKFVVTGDAEIREGFLDLVGSAGSPNHHVAVSFFYQLGGDDLVDSIATFDTPPAKAFVFPVEKTPEADTGFAYAALDGGQPFNLSATLIDENGVEVGTVTWPYDGHDALLFTELFDFLADFIGSLRIEGEASLFLTVVRLEESVAGFQLTNVPPETAY